MRVNPSNSLTVDLAVADELGHFMVCDHDRLGYRFVIGKTFCAPTPVTDQQLAVNEIVTQYFIVGKQPVEVVRVPVPAKKRIQIDVSTRTTYALLGFREGLSRRLGTSRAAGSVPRRARRRS
jgi:hypothetical protein